MKYHSRSKPVFICLVFLGFLLMQSGPLPAAQFDEDVSSQDSLYISGMINTVSTENRTITIKQKKGPRVTVGVNSETEFSGVKKFEDLKASQMIKLWYRPEQGGNTALKIVKLPDLGC